MTRSKLMKKAWKRANPIKVSRPPLKRWARGLAKGNDLGRLVGEWFRGKVPLKRVRVIRAPTSSKATFKKGKGQGSKGGKGK